MFAYHMCRCIISCQCVLAHQKSQHKYVNLAMNASIVLSVKMAEDKSGTGLLGSNTGDENHEDKNTFFQFKKKKVQL